MSRVLSILAFLFLIILVIIWRFCIPPTPPPGPLGDYGDAPDGSLSMETGYYDCQTLPNCTTVASSHVAARFPTVHTNAGPFTVDVDDFWIGPLMPPAAPLDPGNIPSIEAGAQDPGDPDMVPNLDPPRADCDDESAAHDPAATGCQPVPAFLIPPNAMVVILVVNLASNPAWFLTWPYNNTGAITEVVWNVLIDLDKGGSWGNGEWVVQDRTVILPSGTSTLMSDTFRWPTVGQGFFRPLSLPVWIRNTLTSEPVAAGGAAWTGQGPAGGFAVGEIEDYFFEWTPLGQQFSPPEEQAQDQLVAIKCPEGATPGGSFKCGVSGPESKETVAACFPADGQSAVGDGFTAVTEADGARVICAADGFDLEMTVAAGSVAIDLRQAPAGSRILLYREASDPELRRGTNGVRLTGGAVVTVGD